MNKKACQERLQRCGQLMESAGMDVLILVKPANIHYLTGDGRLCAYAMITKDLKVVMGVPQTDIEDVKRLAHFDHIVGFENEVGLIHSVAHYFKDFGITKGVVGLEYSFLPAPRMGMFTHPHAKPEGVEPKDCTPIMSALRLVKDSEEIERMRAAGSVADAGISHPAAPAQCDHHPAQCIQYTGSGRTHPEHHGGQHRIFQQGRTRKCVIREAKVAIGGRAVVSVQGGPFAEALGWLARTVNRRGDHGVDSQPQFRLLNLYPPRNILRLHHILR
ncbi:MAG: aminopeptidase P family N-terminal domain-containing protein [Smithella sp.]|nr:aminopeptidase P family N-terminal domain-containing protein [Smithella sp.]